MIIGVVKHRQLPLIKLIGAIILGKQLEILNRLGELPLLRVNEATKLNPFNVIRNDIKHFLDVFEGARQIFVGLLFTPVFLAGHVGQHVSPNHQSPYILAIEFDRSARVRNCFLGLIRNQIQLGSQSMR